MTPDQRAAARQRCDNATAGPWDVDTSSEGETYSGADAEFVAHARTDLPAALSELDRLEALERRLCEVFGIPYPIHDPGGLDWTHFRKVVNELEGEVGRLKGELADHHCESCDGSAPECRASKKNR